jgi:subtilisin family serine protease
MNQTLSFSALSSLGRSALCGALLFASACASDAPADEANAEPVAESTTMAPLMSSPRPVLGQYIVVLHDREASAQATSAELLRAAGAEALYTYQHSIKGFAARLSETAVKALRADPRVAFIAEDSLVETFSSGKPVTGGGPIGGNIVQPNAPWNLDRIDQRNLPLSTTYNYWSSGSGVHAYVIDTGFRLTHQEYAGRVGGGVDVVTPGGNANDCNGHGTALAGLIGGTTYGVAKSVTLHPVRVLGCNGSGTTAQVIAGVDWVTANHVKPAVANMSIGGAANVALDNAVVNSINAGVTYAVVSGSSATNACNFSPARVGPALTVAASNINDGVASSANSGPCLDLYAPGVQVTTTWNTSDTATITLSGGSMGTAHVSGAVALFLQGSPNATAAQAHAHIVNRATPNVLTGVPAGTANRLLYTGP